jgi:hypothetical protein
MSIDFSNTNKDSVSSRLGSGAAGLATSGAASLTELGAAGVGTVLVLHGKDVFLKNGRKIFPAMRKTITKNPRLSLAFAGLAGLSAFWEAQASKFTNRALFGKKEHQ